MKDIILTTNEQLQLLISEAVSKAFESFQATEAPTNEDTPQFITRKEAAKILGISLNTLHIWTKEERLKAYKMKSRVRYRKDEVLQAVQDQQKYSRIL